MRVLSLPTNKPEDFIVHAELWIFDHAWIKQDPTKFLSVVDMFEYAIRLKQRGFPVRFSCSWELEDEMSQSIGNMRQQALEDLDRHWWK